MADSAYHAARRIGAAAIDVFTAGGISAGMVAKHRPPEEPEEPEEPGHRRRGGPVSFRLTPD